MLSHAKSIWRSLGDAGGSATGLSATGRLRTELGRPSKTVPRLANGCYPLYARTADGDETVLSQRSAGRGLPEAAIIAALAKGTVLAIAD